MDMEMQDNYDPLMDQLTPLPDLDVEMTDRLHTAPKLSFRPKQVSSEKNSGNDTLRPYGIPIYEHMRSLKAKAAEDNTPSVDINDIQEPPAKKQKTNKRPRVLLSEKYRPSDFFDLCGNDDANRHVMRWIHNWRSVVFQDKEPTLNEYTDRLGRPLRKILLLNGPPGTGKTTAAHVIAKKAGYDVLEINASDERGAAVVQDCIVSAIQSHQVYSKNPICIIADEVEDASEHGFVRALIKIINEDAAALSKEEQKNKKKKKNKKKNSLLLRPIIAVCNDAWASSLHNIRPHCEIIHFQRPRPSRLVKRLGEICYAEKIKLSTTSLIHIAEINDFDLRACLNMLQFHNIDGGNGIGISNTNNVTKNTVELTGWSSLVKMQFLSKFPATFKQLECCSELDKLVMSCFTAYPDSDFDDDLLGKPARLGDFLALADNRFANDELKVLAVHASGQYFRSARLAGNLALSGGRVFGKPPSTFETHKQTKGIVQTVMKRAAGPIRTCTTEQSVLLELMPLAVNISSPKLRTVLTAEDKERTKHIARVLMELGISIRSEALSNGTYANRLDPPLEDACIVGENVREEVYGGSYISRSKLRDAISELKSQETRMRTYAIASQRSEKGHTSQTTNNAPTKPIVDLRTYFQGSSGVEQVTATQVARVAETKASRVWVQYSEGFSNAVRKKVSWTDLFKV